MRSDVRSACNSNRVIASTSIAGNTAQTVSLIGAKDAEKPKQEQQ